MNMSYCPSISLRLPLALGLLIAAACCSNLQAAGGGSSNKNPDFTKGDSIPEGAKHDWNLGPTGARGWMFSRKLETREARQIRVSLGLGDIGLQSPMDAWVVMA